MQYTKRLLALFFCMIIISGCWDRRELNEIAIVVGLGIDRIEDDVLLSLQIVNPGNVATQSQGNIDSAPVITYTQRGKTVFEAIRKVTRVSPRKLYFSHLRIVVFSEQAAKQGIAPLLDFLARDHELRTDFYIVISRNIDARHIFEITTLMDRVPANKLYSSLENSERNWAGTGKMTIDKLIEKIALEGEEAVLTGIIVLGGLDEGKTMDNTHRLALRTLLQYEGMAFFNEDRMVGWLSDKESRIYNYITNHVVSSVEVNACPDQDGEVAVEIIDSQSKVKGMVRNDYPEVEVNLEILVNLGELECSVDLKHEQTIQQIEKMLEDLFTEEAEKTIAKMQTEYRTDIFGFGEAIHRANPRYWRQHKEHWNDIFAELDVKVQADFHVKAIGAYDHSIPMLEEKEKLR